MSSLYRSSLLCASLSLLMTAHGATTASAHENSHAYNDYRTYRNTHWTSSRSGNSDYGYNLSPTYPNDEVRCPYVREGSVWKKKCTTDTSSQSTATTVSETTNSENALSQSEMIQNMMTLYDAIKEVSNQASLVAAYTQMNKCDEAKEHLALAKASEESFNTASLNTNLNDVSSRAAQLKTMITQAENAVAACHSEDATATVAAETTPVQAVKQERNKFISCHGFYYYHIYPNESASVIYRLNNDGIGGPSCTINETCRHMDSIYTGTLTRYDSGKNPKTDAPKTGTAVCQLVVDETSSDGKPLVVHGSVQVKLDDGSKYTTTFVPWKMLNPTLSFRLGIL